jgi:uncharacterized protein
MFFKVTDFQLGRVRFHETFPPGAIEFFDQQLQQSAPILASGAAELSDATQEIRVSGHLSTRMDLACDRCLEPTVFPLDADFSLLYRPAASLADGEEAAIDDKEAEVGFYEGQGLDLRDVLREEILLLLPMQRVCSQDCQGICPLCGQNRNEVACDCRQELADDRWAGLRNL